MAEAPRHHAQRALLSGTESFNENATGFRTRMNDVWHNPETGDRFQALGILVVKFNQPEALDRDLVILNDADAVGLAELRFGARRPRRRALDRLDLRESHIVEAGQTTGNRSPAPSRETERHSPSIAIAPPTSASPTTTHDGTIAVLGITAMQLVENSRPRTSRLGR